MPTKNNRRGGKLKAFKEHWLRTAQEVAQTSIHPTVKVGAVLEDARGNKISSSANALPRGLEVNEHRLADGNKSNFFECAEALTIADAARRGKATNGTRMYVTLSPCTRCAGAIIHAGIKEVVVVDQPHPPKLKDKWRKSIEIGAEKLQEAGVQLIKVTLT